VLDLGADGRYVHALTATEGLITNVPGCPQLVVNLDELWAEIDRLGPAGDAPKAEGLRRFTL